MTTKVKKHRCANVMGSVLVFAFLVCSMVVALFPFAWMLSSSVKTETTMFVFPIQWIPETFHLENYAKAWEMLRFPVPFFNSVKVATVITVGQVFTSITAAYAFAKIAFRGRNQVFLGYLATMMVPFQVVMIPQFIMFRQMGLINTHMALMLPGMFSAFGVFMLRQFFLGIPDELLEAARIDGCSEPRILFQIITPLSKAAIASLAIFTFRWQWNDYLAPLIYLNDKAMLTLPVALSTFRMENLTLYTLIMAASVISLVPVLVVYLFTQKHLIQGIAMAGIKG